MYLETFNQTGSMRLAVKVTVQCPLQQCVCRLEAKQPCYIITLSSSGTLYQQTIFIYAFSLIITNAHPHTHAHTHMHRLEDDVEKKNVHLIFSMDSHVFDPQICNSCFTILGYRTLIIPRTPLYETNNHDPNNGGQYNRDIPTRRWGKRNQELTSTNQVDQGGVDISLVTPSPLTAYTIQ